MTRKQKKVLIRIIVSTLLLLGIIAFERLVGFPDSIAFAIVRTMLYLAPYFIIGYDILKKAFKGILNRQPFDENFLMAVATIGAMAIAVYENGEYTEAIAVMLFYQIGELFQSVAVGKSRRSIASLMDIRPDYANVERNGEIVTVSPDEVEVGEIIVASAGERIAIDGVVVDGETSLDTSSLTGESVPQDVHVGNEVISGSVNISGTIRIRTTKPFGESTVSKILDLVENSSSKKSQSEKFISKFARIYTPAVCYSALALAVLPPIIRLIAGYEALWSQWIYRALTFLVISCPCALVISIPLTFFAGIGGASREGILVKGSNYLDVLSKTKYVVFDKTGTITKGVFEVVDVKPSGDLSADELVEISACAEYFSSHPISNSLKTACNKTVDVSRVADVKEISGHGITAIVDGKAVAVGNARLLKMLNLDFEECNEVGTVVYVAIDEKYAGYILISDTLKPTSSQAIKALKNMGIKKIVMLTGDSRRVADSVAKQLEIDEVHSELLPADKVEIAEGLISQKVKRESLAFVGDGINDAPVLSIADVGIAMGGLGSDAAIEAADIVLMDDDISKLAKAIGIAKKCIKIANENIYFALGVKAICLILGALGIANMWLAIFADVGVMVIAVINAIRALNVKRI